MQPDYAALLELLRGRRSVRRFRGDPLPEGTAEKLVEAARWAPSAGNRQSWRILAVESARTRAELAEAVKAATLRLKDQARADTREELGRYLENFLHFAQAPLLLVPIFRSGGDLLETMCGGASERSASLDSLASVSAAVQNLLLAAHALGLGACWMTGPLVAATPLRALLKVPEGWQIAALVPVGFPESEPANLPPRRDLHRLLQKAG